MIGMLKVDYFNPVVKNWTPECQAEERRQRQSCDYVLYVITPEMTGVYSVAEVTDDSNKRPAATVFCVLREYGGKRFEDSPWKSLEAVATLVAANGGTTFLGPGPTGLAAVAQFLNRVAEDA